MNDLAKRAQDVANRARTAPAPRNEPTGYSDTSDHGQTAPRRSWWLIRKADSQEVRVLFAPPLRSDEVRQRFYPDALAILPTTE